MSPPTVLALGGVDPVMAGCDVREPVKAGELAITSDLRGNPLSHATGTVGPSVSRGKVDEVSLDQKFNEKHPNFGALTSHQPIATTVSDTDMNTPVLEPLLQINLLPETCMNTPVSEPSVECGKAPLQTDEKIAREHDECDLFLKCHVSVLLRFSFSKLCQRAATFEPCAIQLGVLLLQLLLVSPRDGAKIRKWIGEQVFQTSTSPTRVRDLLPLPLPPAGAALKLMDQCEVTDVGLLIATSSTLHESKKVRRQQAKKTLLEGCKQIWRVVIVIVLNGLNSNWVYPPTCKARLSEPQEAAMGNINRWIDAFCANPMTSHKLPEFSALVKSKTIDYAGEEVAHALPLRLEELLPGLPVQGVAGSLSAVKAASGEVRGWVQDPSLALKPQELWPKKNPKARINATRDEWFRICEELFQRGIIECIRLEDVFKANGSPVLNGAFAVEKKGQPGVGQVRVTRLIMNFVPANSFQKLMQGDLSTLASSSSWTQFVLGPNEVLLWSGDDQRGAFYAWELPKAWRPFMAFAWPVPGHLVGGEPGKMEYVASRVIPMGWIQAVSLFQHLHRSLGMTKQPAGAGHDVEKEWRRDRPVPQTSDGKVTEFVQFYLDDFDCPEVVPSVGWEDMVGTVSATHSKQRDAYQRWGVGISEDKAHVRDPRVIRMGAEVDGISGSVGAPILKKFEVSFFALWCMGLHHPPTKVLLMVLGRLVRCFEFRRPLMSLLHSVWPKGSPMMRKPLSSVSMQELLLAVSILPLAGADLRGQVSNMVTCTDASETGGGLCCSGGLTEEGKHALIRSQTSELASRSGMCFQPQGALKLQEPSGPRIVVVSLFDGIAALMVGLCRLDCQVLAFASSEVDKECKRLVRKRWPGVIELGDIEKIDRAKIEALHRSV